MMRRYLPFVATVSIFMVTVAIEQPLARQELRVVGPPTNRVPAVVGRSGCFGLRWLLFGGVGAEQLTQTPYISEKRPDVQTSLIHGDSTKSPLHQLQQLYGHFPQCCQRHR